jgi:hypothetical protein
MKFVVTSILIFVWTTYVYYTVPGIVASIKQSKQHNSCNFTPKKSTIKEEDCCTKLHKTEKGCDDHTDNHDENDDCCKTTHCPRTCCQTFVLNLMQVGNFTFGLSQFHDLFGERKQSNLKEPFLGIVSPPPNVFFV